MVGARPRPHFRKLRRSDALQRYTHEGGKGPIAGAELAHMQSVARDLQAGRSPKPPAYSADVWAGGGQVRLIAWSDREIFALLDFRNGFSRQPDTMKWHLIRSGSEWLIEGHGDTPAGRWEGDGLAACEIRLANLRPGVPPQEVEAALGKAQSATPLE